MQETLQALQGLQQIDRHLFKVQAELQRLPAELAKRKEHLAKLEAKLAEVRQCAHALRSEAKEIEDFTVGMRQRQRKLETESTRTKIDAALLASYQHEMRTIKRNVSQAEDDALKKMEAADQTETEAKKLAEALTEEQAVFAEFETNVANETAAATSREAELQAERAKLSAESINGEHLELYRRLLKIREGEALAELADGHCQACFVQIPKNLGVRLARGTDLVQCPSCDRIFFQY